VVSGVLCQSCHIAASTRCLAAGLCELLPFAHVRSIEPFHLGKPVPSLHGAFSGRAEDGPGPDARQHETCRGSAAAQTPVRAHHSQKTHVGRKAFGCCSHAANCACARLRIFCKRHPGSMGVSCGHHRAQQNPWNGHLNDPNDNCAPAPSRPGDGLDCLCRRSHWLLFTGVVLVFWPGCR